MKANRLVLLAVAGTAALALSGCQSGNVAARVGDTTVTTSEVDFLTRVNCETLDKAAEDPTEGAGSQTVSLAQMRAGMVNTLIQAELNRRLAEREDLTYDQTTLRGVMDQFESVVALAPEDDRDRFRDIVESVYRGQLQVYTFAQGELRAQGNANPAQEEVDQAVAQIQDDFRKSFDIEINPEYGAGADGIAGSEDASLSLAVSSFAKDSVSADPDPTWVSDLPDNQRCG